MKLEVGDVVALNMPMLGCEIGTRGVVYETYKDFDDKGVMLVKENVFPYQKKSYEFKNVMKLTEDFRAGYWNDIFV